MADFDVCVECENPIVGETAIATEDGDDPAHFGCLDPVEQVRFAQAMG